jgi:hypothetical protein
MFLTAMSGALFWAHTGTGAQGFSARTVTPFVGQAFRYGFGFIGLVAVVAAVSATGARTGSRWTVAAALIGALSGVFSGTLSEAIKAATFTGNEIEWASGLLHRLGAAPGEALGELVSALQERLPDVVAPTLAWGFGTALVTVAGPAAWKRLRAATAPRRAVAAILVVGLGVIAIDVGRARRDAARDVLYGGVTQWISTNVAPGETVGYTFSVYSYLFYGRDLSAEVAYLPATSGSRAEWEERLADRGVSVVALGPSLGRRRSWEELSAEIVELAWLENAGSDWERVFGEDISVTPWLWRRKGRGAP